MKSQFQQKNTEDRLEKIELNLEKVLTIVERQDLNSNQKEVVLPEEVNRLFQISDNTRRKWERQGILHPKKIGRRVYYLQVDIDQLLKDLEDEYAH